VTNNHVTAETRVFAKRLDVEIIADAEWTEFKRVCTTRKIINPNPHRGLMGIVIAHMTRNKAYLNEAVEA